VYDNKGEYDKALKDYTQAIQINPKDSDIYNNRGNTYYNKREYDKAFDDCNKAIEINSKNDKAYGTRGRTYSDSGMYDKAFDDFKKAIDLNPKSDMAYNVASWLLATCPDEKYRNGKEAIEFAKKAVELKPNESHYWDTLAAAYAEAGKFEDAVKVQEKAIEMLTEKDRNEYLSKFTERLNSYTAKKPWREKLKTGK